MDKNVLVGLLSDPNIDPTEWVGKALITWISANTRTCFRNKKARPYLLKAMDAHEAANFSSLIRDIVKEENDLDLLKDFIERCNKLSFHKWSLHEIDRNLCGLFSSVSHKLIDIVLKLKMDESTGGYYIVQYITNHHQIETLLKNRHCRFGSYWNQLVELIPEEELGRLFENQIGKQFANGALDQQDVQNLLEKIAMLLPKKDWPKWINYVKNTNLSKVWKEHDKNLVSKKRSLETIKLDETVCRCGYVAANRSGLKTHGAKCKSEYKDDKPSIHLIAKLLDAEYNNKLYCKNCVKICSTESGLALHHKACKGKKDLLEWFITKSKIRKSLAESLQKTRKEKFIETKDNNENKWS